MRVIKTVEMTAQRAHGYKTWSDSLELTFSEDKGDDLNKIEVTVPKSMVGDFLELMAKIQKDLAEKVDED